MKRYPHIYKFILGFMIAVLIGFAGATVTYAEEEEYSVIVIDGDNGTIKVTYSGEEILGGEYVKRGAVVRMSNEPDEYYRFSHYLINGEIYHNPQYIVTEDVEISAVFVPKTYKITKKVTKGQGNISVGDKTTVDAGEEVTIKAEPSPGYMVSQMFVNGDDVTDMVLDNEYVTDDTWEGLDIRVSFEKLKLTIETSTDGNGVIKAAEEVEYGNDLYITFEPNEGYMLGDVYVDDDKVEVSNNIYVLSDVKENHTIYAEFAEIYYSVTVNTGENGTASESDTVRYKERYELDIKPDKGYQIEMLIVNGEQVYPTGNKYVIDGVKCDTEINVTFELNEMAKVNILSVTSLNTHELKVLWENVDGAEGYKIYRMSENETEYKLVGTVRTGYFEQSYIDTKVSCGVKYYYKVKAYKERWGDKLYGQISGAKSGKAVPERVKISSVHSIGITALEVKWGKVKGVQGYEIYISNAKNGKYKLYKRINGNTKIDREQVLNKLSKGTKYYIKIRAYCNIHNEYVYGKFSSAKNCTTTSFTPVKGVKAGMKGFDYVKIKWSKKSGADGYVIYWSEKKNGTYQRIATIKGKNTLEYHDMFYVTGKNYYKVKAYKDVDGKRVYGSESDVAGVNAIIK